MFLSIDISAPFKNVFAPPEHPLSIAQFEGFWWDNEFIFGKSDTRVSDNFQRLDGRSYLFNCHTRRFFGFGKYQRNRHPLKINFTIGKQRLVENNAADLVFTHYIFR